MASPLANAHPAPPPPTDTSRDSQTDPTTSRPETTTDPEVPLTSLDDDGQSRRPRDARLIHFVLSQQGIHSYQERVPLQLLDFAYRYTSGILNDSLRLAADGYGAGNERGKRGGGGAVGEDGGITVTSLRQAIASRTGYAFQGALPKEFMLEQAAERNRLALPRVERGYGVQLPPEKFCLTGTSWGLKEEWDSETEVDEEDESGAEVAGNEVDEEMGGMNGTAGEDGQQEENENEDEDEEGAGRMEDVFGHEDGEDTSMT